MLPALREFAWKCPGEGSLWDLLKIASLSDPAGHSLHVFHTQCLPRVCEGSSGSLVLTGAAQEQEHA